MGKRSSSIATAEGAAKKAKKIAATRHSDSPTVGQWDCSKFVEKDLRKAAKEELLKDDAETICMLGPEATPTPPARFWVMFMAFILRRLSFPAHDFLRGLLFAYGVQLHDLTPNTIVHIACFITLCECFLGIEPHWALWRRVFAVMHPSPYQTDGFSCLVRPDVKYFNLRNPENNLGWRTKWFYVKDQPATGNTTGLEEFHFASDLRPRQS
jgi:hypothetical protein